VPYYRATDCMGVIFSVIRECMGIEFYDENHIKIPVVFGISPLSDMVN
jgi:hypothetical protein